MKASNNATESTRAVGTKRWFGRVVRWRAGAAWTSLVSVTDDRVILITGATSGLGRWLAVRLAAGGARLLVHGRDPERIATLAEELRADGGDAEPLVADLSSLSQTARLAAEVARRGRLDVLVNNAGIGYGRPGSGRELGPEGHELRWTVNYLAPVVLARGLTDRLTRSAPARIVNVGSLGQADVDLDDLDLEHGYDGTVAYRRSKLALAAWSFDLAAELAGTGVTVNCVHPATFMGTAMVREAGLTPRSKIEDGGGATLRLIDDPALAGVTGGFFDGRSPARARDQAYDEDFRRALRVRTDEQLKVL
jgi:NAD(P)-dependent dehydrogenase (short-subunit alcohol dehydrogenase family)